MQRSQTALLLAKAQLVDNRTVDEYVIEAWHEVVAALDYDDAMAALTEHRRTSTEYLTPAHIVTGVRAIRKARLDRGTNSEGIPDADPDDVTAYLAALRERRVQLAAGDTPRPVTALVQATTHQMPQIPRNGDAA